MKSVSALATLAAIGTAYAVPSATKTSTARQELSCSTDRTPFQYFGVNESGAEFGQTTIPGVLGTDYTWPAPR